jgi:steroid delta-isomerase-like uncharacterized protein
MTNPDNEAVLRRYVQAVWGEHNADAAADFFTPDYRRHLSPSAEALDAQQQITRLRGFMAAFPDVTMSVETMVGDGDLVAFAGIMRGTHTGDFKGMAASGKAFAIYLYDMVRIVDGRIAEHWGGPDLHDLEQQVS